MIEWLWQNIDYIKQCDSWDYQMIASQIIVDGHPEYTDGYKQYYLLLPENWRLNNMSKSLRQPNRGWQLSRYKIFGACSPRRSMIMEVIYRYRFVEFACLTPWSGLQRHEMLEQKTISGGQLLRDVWYTDKSRFWIFLECNDSDRPMAYWQKFDDLEGM